MREKFFEDEGSLRVLKELGNKLQNMDGLGESYEGRRNEKIYMILNSMIESPGEWDELCEFTIENIGHGFIEHVKKYKVSRDSKDYMDMLCAYCHEFLVEFYLSNSRSNSRVLESARAFIEENLDRFESNARSYIESSMRGMPIEILKKITTSEELKEFKKFNALVEKAKGLKSEWDKELANKQARVDALKDAFDERDNDYNFVALDKGFKNLAVQKLEEKKETKKWLVLLGVLILLPLFLEVIYVLYQVSLNVADSQGGDSLITDDRFKSIRNTLLLLIVPMIPLMAISVYYFRILLLNYKSTKSQLLQLELRRALCQFIISYMEKTRDLKDGDKGSFSKFESIIFSGIVADSEKMPSTYDGMEQLAKLAQSFKGQAK
ncbi:hypothetical protein [Microbulbifer variabilis]|uniref:hypothetical protein n=1 Tax=Microbulbifer variabilis TaxID=266805 RepID=UPI00037EB316|nr:hypothetical protein [Microbulbifer variabilis]